MTDTITCSQALDTSYEGCTLISKSVETRWWRRFWYWVTFRKCPLREKTYTIVSVDSNTTLTVR